VQNVFRGIERLGPGTSTTRKGAAGSLEQSLAAGVVRVGAFWLYTSIPGERYVNFSDIVAMIITDTAGTDGMRRRRYLSALVAVGSTATAGCGSLANLGGPSQEPDEVAEEFIEAMNDGDTEEMRESLHEEHESDPLESETLEEWEAYDIAVDDTDVVEEGDDTAVVDVTYSLDTDSESISSESSSTARFELRIDDGEWRVWKLVSS